MLSTRNTHTIALNVYLSLSLEVALLDDYHFHSISFFIQISRSNLGRDQIMINIHLWQGGTFAVVTNAEQDIFKLACETAQRFDTQPAGKMIQDARFCLIGQG